MMFVTYQNYPNLYSLEITQIYFALVIIKNNYLQYMGYLPNWLNGLNERLLTSTIEYMLLQGCEAWSMICKLEKEIALMLHQNAQDGDYKH